MVLIGLKLVESCSWIRRVLTARFPVLVVDEYQDLGLPLHRLVLSLCFGADKACRLFAVGDYDQSIYSFTGAKPELLVQLAAEARVERIQLRLNYRSRPKIIAASEFVLGEKRGYEAAAGDGGVIEFYRCKNGFGHQVDVVGIKLIQKVLDSGAARNLGEIALLYRDKSLGDVVADRILNAGYQFIRIDANAPYRCTPFTTWLEETAAWCSGGWRRGIPRLSDLLLVWRWFNRKIVTDSEIVASRRSIVRFLYAHRDGSISLKRWLDDLHESCLRLTFEQEPLTADDARNFSRILGLRNPDKPFCSWTVARFGGQVGSPDHLNLMTFHSAKSLEFDVVFMLGLDQGIIPDYRETTPASKKESRRLFYVGLTRARHEVHMLCSGWRDSPYGPKHDGPSEFLLELHRALNTT
jgi:DNA helicase II / ATP-dependent DNA helicase PcrA